MAMANWFHTIDRKLHRCVHEATKIEPELKNNLFFMLKEGCQKHLKECFANVLYCIVLALVKLSRDSLEGSHGYFEISAGPLVKLRTSGTSSVAMKKY